MEAVPFKSIAVNDMLREALETHIGLSGEDISFALASLNPNTTLNPGYANVTKLTTENLGRLVMLLHQKLYTGMRARVFNYIVDWGIRNRDPGLTNKVLDHIDDGFWEVAYVQLTPKEKEDIEDTEQLELSSVLAVLNNQEAISRLCSGELCKEAICDVEFPAVIQVPGTFGNFTARSCFSYSGLIEALTKDRDPFTGEPFSDEVIRQYSLDIKLAKWSARKIESLALSGNKGRRVPRETLDRMLANLAKA